MAYLDNDSLVVRHAQVLLAGDPGVLALSGDARGPQAILDDHDLLYQDATFLVGVARKP